MTEAMSDPLLPKKHREAGSILVLILILMVPLAGLALALVTQGSTHTRELGANRGRAAALVNAESGIDHALSQLLQDPTNLDLIQETYPGSANLRYLVEFSDLGADALDNDGDLDVDEADEDGFVSLTSAGSLNVLGYDAAGDPISENSHFYLKRIRAIGKANNGLPGFPYAVYLGDENAEVDFNGNAFLIDGNDHDADGNTTAGAAVPGIATVGDPVDIEDQISNQQSDNVIGSGGEPSVHNTASLPLQDYIDEYKASADIQFNNPSGTFTGSLGNPDGPVFKVTHCVGNLDISGGAVGAGLLLIEGNLEITGSFEYVGVMIVTGQVIFRGGGGVKRVIGTCLVGGDFIEGAPHDEDLELSGTIDILYSSAIQDDLSGSLATFKILSWQEL